MNPYLIARYPPNLSFESVLVRKSFPQVHAKVLEFEFYFHLYVIDSITAINASNKMAIKSVKLGYESKPGISFSIFSTKSFIAVMSSSFDYNEITAI